MLAACSWTAISDVRTVDLSAVGHRSAASGAAIGGGISSRRPQGINLLVVGLMCRYVVAGSAV